MIENIIFRVFKRKNLKKFLRAETLVMIFLKMHGVTLVMIFFLKNFENARGNPSYDYFENFWKCAGKPYLWYFLKIMENALLWKMNWEALVMIVFLILRMHGETLVMIFLKIFENERVNPSYIYETLLSNSCGSR